VVRTHVDLGRILEDLLVQVAAHDAVVVDLAAMAAGLALESGPGADPGPEPAHQDPDDHREEYEGEENVHLNLVPGICRILLEISGSGYGESGKEKRRETVVSRRKA